MSILSVASAILGFFWNLFTDWIYLFFVSFTKLDTIWIIVPIWLAWFFAEFFQEKEGTSFGNAISNGVVPFWVGIDWLRQITNNLLITKSVFTVLIFFKYLISILVILYGCMIIYYGIKGKEVVKYLGRIRDVTYVLVILTPFIYGLIKPDIMFLLAIVIYFPIFYFIIEAIDKLAPRPQIYEKDLPRAAEPFSSEISRLPPMQDFSKLR